MHRIDLNCDIGEGMPTDAAIMPYISSANIACGFHAGDNDTMKRTVALAMWHQVAIGAHPGYDDKPNFGRTDKNISKEALFDLVTEQVYSLQKIVQGSGGLLHHVKPHGALYNQSARNETIAIVIAEAVAAVDTSLLLFGLSGSVSISAAKNHGLKTVSEVFADRSYQPGGSLTPRSQPNALLESEEASMQQVLQMIQEQTVTAVTGETVPILAETICIHGDGEHAVLFAKNIHQFLQQNHILLKPVDP